MAIVRLNSTVQKEHNNNKNRPMETTTCSSLFIWDLSLGQTQDRIENRLHIYFLIFSVHWVTLFNPFSTIQWTAIPTKWSSTLFNAEMDADFLAMQATKASALSATRKTSRRSSSHPATCPALWHSNRCLWKNQVPLHKWLQLKPPHLQFCSLLIR